MLKRNSYALSHQWHLSDFLIADASHRKSLKLNAWIVIELLLWVEIPFFGNMFLAKNASNFAAETENAKGIWTMS